MKKQVWYFVIKDRAAHDAHIVDVYNEARWHWAAIEKVDRI